MMMLMTPVMMVGNQVDTRKSGKVKFDDQVADLRTRLDKRQREVAEALLAERAERIDQSPDLADLARRAMLRTLDLWSRQRGDAEFLRTRLGIGTVASKVTVEPDTSGEEYLRDAVNAALAGHDRLPASPICVNLAELGVFGLHGEPVSVQAMCSSVLLQAATLHSPEDLVIVVLEGYDQGLGTWVKWLPHTRSATSPHRRRPHHRHAPMRRPPCSASCCRSPGCEPPTTRATTAGRGSSSSSTNRPTSIRRWRRSCSSCARRPASRWWRPSTRDARVPRQAKATFRCVPAIRRRRVVGVVHRARRSRRGVRARAGERPADRQGGDVARPAARRHLRQRHDGDPPGRAAAVVVRLGTADAAVDQRHVVEADALRVAGADRRRPRRPARARPGGARTPRAHRRHERRRQERAAPVDRVGVDPRVPADATDLPVRRLQGRRRHRRVRRRRRTPSGTSPTSTPACRCARSPRCGPS